MLLYCGLLYIFAFCIYGWKNNIVLLCSVGMAAVIRLANGILMIMYGQYDSLIPYQNKNGKMKIK